MTETTTRPFSPKMKDDLRKAADILWGSLNWRATPSGYDYWHNAYVKLYELSGTVPPLFCPRESTPGKFELGKGKPKTEGSGYSGKIGDWQKFAAAANYICGMSSWDFTSSGSDYWYDVYERVHSFKYLGTGSSGATAEQIANEQKMAKEAKKANQSGFKFDPTTLCVCGHAYHAHSRKRGCKFHAKDQCFKFTVKSVSDVMAVEPSATPKPEDFLEL